MNTYVVISAAVAAAVCAARICAGIYLKVPFWQHSRSTLCDAVLYGVLWPVMLFGTIMRHVNTGGANVGAASDQIFIYTGHAIHVFLPLGYRCAIEADPDRGYRLFTATGILVRVRA